MADITYYVALPFVPADDGVAPGEAVEFQSPGLATRAAEVLSRKEGNVGAVAFSRTGDPMIGESAEAVVLKSYGEVPADLSTL